MARVHFFRHVSWVKSFAGAALIALLALPVAAAQIVGDITFSGDFSPVGGTNLGNATGIDFLGDDLEVNGATGDFAGIAQGDIGFLQDFDFNPLNPSPVDPLWSIAGFSFALESVVVEFQNPDFLILSAMGTLSGNGFDDTAATWSLTANRAGGLFNFSAGTTSQIPEAGTALLLLSGLVASQFRRRSAS